MLIVFDCRWDAVIDIVELIEKENILSPTQVFSILSLNPDLPLKVVSNYVNNVFHVSFDDFFSFNPFKWLIVHIFRRT